MRPHFSPPAFFEGARAIAPMLVGIVPFGIVCGIGAIAVGASPFAALAMSMIMFSGAAQIVAVQLLATGAPFAVILLSCLVVSLRLVMYSAAMAPHLRRLDHRWRAALSFLLTDQAFAGTLQRFQKSDDVGGNASYFLGTGACLWVTWQIATLAGIVAGQVIPGAWQLDFVVPLCFLAVLVPLLRDRISMLVFVVATVAVIALDAIPLRLSLVCGGLLAIAAGVLGDKIVARHE
ncbi:MAG TPA: AzlC family ABC transporter permease [Casimicrobiaceae bacterium]|jgi:predicted branched-subunit amino acid permease|nr:AzlC family ABC transporter permease [Casimicrobiaceae bacterium]